MSFVCLLIALVASARVHAEDASQALPNRLAKVSSLPAGQRPAGVPGDYVITPNGYFAQDCVQVVHASEKLRADGRIEQAGGGIRSTPACGKSHYDVQGRRIDRSGHVATGLATAAGATPGVGITPASYTGWIESANFTSSTPIGRLRASWRVPNTPSNVGNQVVYLFPGLEQTPTVVSILQPVLGWNCCGDQTWSITSWNCCVDGTTYVSDKVDVSPGDEIVGDTYSLCGEGVEDCGEWSIVTQDTTSGQSTTLSNSNPQGRPDWVFGGVLEVYNLDSCDKLPPDGTVAYYDIQVWDTNGNLQGQPWGHANASSSISPQCNYGISSSDGNVTLSF
jgi:hypothetical protein